MFDFSKIGLLPTHIDGFRPAATDAQIAELEQHCGYPLPENYKLILRHYNGCCPTAKYFDVIDEDGIPGEWTLYDFYTLDQDKESPANIWWTIKHYGADMGPNTIPFAEDRADQIYYFKWVNDAPQVWMIGYDYDVEAEDVSEPGVFVLDSFDTLLNSLYA